MSNEYMDRAGAARAARIGIVAFAAALMMLPAALRADVIAWDGDGGDGLWTNGVNWSGNAVPAAGDTINIGNGDTVRVTGLAPSGNLPLGSTVNLTGNSTLSNAGDGALRLNFSTVTVASGSTLTGNFWDLNGGSLVLDDGAVVDMTQIEHKGNNTFTFNLGASGFTAITPGTLFFGNNGSFVATMSNATYNVDFANYAGGNATYTLIDFTSASITAETIQWATYNPLNDAGYTSSLSYDEGADSIRLNIQVVPEPGVLTLTGIAGMVLLIRRSRQPRRGA